MFQPPHGRTQPTIQPEHGEIIVKIALTNVGIDVIPDLTSVEATYPCDEPETVTSNRFEQFSVGQVERLERVLGAEDVQRFVDLTGDTNPVHLDDAYAAGVGFEHGRIVNGLLSASFVATLIGTRLPGPGALELSQRFNFRAPVLIGERIRVEGRIRRLSPAIRAMVLDVKVLNDRDQVVLDGEAVVQLLEQPIDE